MGKCCYKEKNNEQAKTTTVTRPAETELTTRKLISNLKSSIFCGTRGFLTFSLAFLSYLEYSAYHNTKLKEDAAFAMKRNIIPFGEMIITPLLACFVLPAMVCGLSLLQCTLICTLLMVATCFVVRTLNLRERLMKKTTDYGMEVIDSEFKKDTMRFPIFDKNRKHIGYNSPNQEQSPHEAYIFSFLKVLLFPLKILLKALQSCIILTLAAVELLEIFPSLCVDLIFDRSFVSTKSSLQKSGHLLYASVRNLVPVTKFDECIANLIGTPKATCCGA